MTTAVVPAWNEAARLGATLAALHGVPEIDAVIVVDDGSTDDTAVIAEAAGATVVRLPRNAGKGAALAAGVAACDDGIVVLLDADLGDSAREAGGLVRPVADGLADMTIAVFPTTPGRRGGFGFVVRLARWGILRATGQTMRAPLSGQRAARRAVLERVGGFAPGFGAEVALTIDALRAGFRVLEVPCAMSHRVTGRDLRSFRHRSRQFVAVARALWARRVWSTGGRGEACS